MGSRLFLELIWKDQAGLFEVATTLTSRQHLSFDDAVKARGMNYFAPLPRARPRFRDKDVVDTGNVLWVDIDSRDALSRVERSLHPVDIHPSAIVDSGNKGYWLYFKLDRHIRTKQIVELNKRLIALVDGDRACSNPSRVARIPGSIHPGSGKTVTLIDMPGTRFDPNQIFALTAAVDAEEGAKPEESPELQLGSFGPVPAFTAAEHAYIRSRPAAGPGTDRSAVEQRLFTKMIYAGWSDEAIIAFADRYQLPKHMEERSRSHSYRWIELSLRNAHAYIEQMSLTLSMEICVSIVRHVVLNSTFAKSLSVWTDRQ